MYKVNEIFLSLQGEGYHSGTAMVFLRFSGCNLKCPFCDTEHTDHKLMSAEEIIEQMRFVGKKCRTVCITGGEPLLQLDSNLIDMLHADSWKIHVETNGSHVPEGDVISSIDWITLSPKSDFVFTEASKVRLQRADELKLVFPEDESLIEKWEAFPADNYFLQPCSGQRIPEIIEYITAHPLWRLSLQVHKYLNIR